MRISDAARAMNVSVRSVERARFVRRQGVPELEAEVMAGTLCLGAAECIARAPVMEQRAILALDNAGRAGAVKELREGQRAGRKPEKILLPPVTLEKARLLADRWGCSTAEAVRRCIDET